MTISVRGVALIVTNPAKRILVLQEFQDKPELGKRAGMFSVPMETIYAGENDRTAFQRLGCEELPGVLAPGFATEPIGEYWITPNALAYLHTAQAESDALPTVPTHLSEVGNHRWVSMQEVRKFWYRQGVDEMLEDFLAGRRDVVRKKCRRPRGLVWP